VPIDLVVEKIVVEPERAGEELEDVERQPR
jgi:hypothetical protein